MLYTVDPDIFKYSESIQLIPVVSAEWNHNLFNQPYITVAGSGTKMQVSPSSGTISDVSGGLAKPNFTTKSFAMSDGTGSISYSVTADSGSAYKIVTYIKTDNPIPVMISSFCKGSSSQYGSEQDEASSLGWTKVVTYIGSSGESDTISSFTYTITANSISGADTDATIYFTVPEVYKTSYFDYKNHSLWPTESPFTYFRPAESYVSSGNTNCTFPSNFRKITSQVIPGYSAPTYFPASPILQNPQFFLASSPVPVLKTSLPTDISPYKYFVSHNTSRSITAKYEKAIKTNKLVLKFNTIMTIPSFNIFLNNSGTAITVDGSQSITIPSNSDSFNTGILTLYWTGSAWTKTKWSTMPQFNSAGQLALATDITSITVTQTGQTINSAFSSYSGQNVTDDLERMHAIEISPRLEIDLSGFVQDLSIDKSLDGSNSALPISSMNTNSAQIVLSGIPATSGVSLVPIFSSQNSDSSTVLANLLRKNIKFYVNFHLSEYASAGSFTSGLTTLIPGGVFYSDSWEEKDIDTVTVQCFDISRYLQSTPVPDYVANLKSVFDIITNILDLAGFTDYDYDSLYSICNNKAAPLDLAYFYCNSKDSTIIGTLNNLFVAYQIGAYIDEYGIMKFLSLHNILSSQTPSVYLDDANIMQGGYSVSNKAKPGKISLRYQLPKVKQSPSLQNVNNVDIKNSAAFAFSQSNDVVWQQQNIDSVGFNYINADMSQTSNSFNINVNDLLDIFHTFNLDSNGYAFIENEIVSFLYKEYKISKTGGTPYVNVSVKNNLELTSEINKFIKSYSVGLKTSDGETKEDYDIIVEPTGNITNVQRGLFGTVPSEHTRITDLSSKNLSEIYMTKQFDLYSSSGLSTIIDDNDGDSTLPSIKKIKLESTQSHRTMILPTSQTDIGYATYSVKFDMPDQDVSSAGLFFNMESITSSSGAYFVELVRFNQTNPSTGLTFDPARYKYLLLVYNSAKTDFFWADVTGECNSVVNNFSKIIKKELLPNDTYSYSYVTETPFNLKVVKYTSDGTDGEYATLSEPRTVISAYINNVEITGWQTVGFAYDPDTNELGTGWQPTDINKKTGMRQKPSVLGIMNTGTKFGYHTSTAPTEIPDLSPAITYPNKTSSFPSNLREIHATKKPLKERSVSYFYQDREFLNGLVQNQPLYSNSPTYIMQTTPEVAGINYYDVQYETPAAVSVDVLPIEYMWYYFPGTDPQDQKNYQKKLIDEYSLAYSTPINTGFRAKMAIANNSSNMVFLYKESDDLDRFNINLNLWTHEIVAPAAPEIIEKILDYSNISEVAQLDSEWIQSKEAAYKTLKLIEMGIEGFSKDVMLDIFGNPLIQIGDVVRLSYSLNGISQQNYVVHSVSHSFSQGLSTRLVLNRLY